MGLLTKRFGDRRPPGHGKGGILALVFLLALGGCGLGGWVGNVRTYRLTITSAPPRADVYVNGIHQGKTPLIITYQVGLGDVLRGFDIRLEKEGYLPIRREVPYDAGRLHFKLVRPRYLR
ncbi:MAG: PEGA domain-containing protein [Nitrospinota bacterium]